MTARKAIPKIYVQAFINPHQYNTVNRIYKRLYYGETKPAFRHHSVQMAPS